MKKNPPGASKVRKIEPGRKRHVLPRQPRAAKEEEILSCRRCVLLILGPSSITIAFSSAFAATPKRAPSFRASLEHLRYIFRVLHPEVVRTSHPNFRFDCHPLGLLER